MKPEVFLMNDIVDNQLLDSEMHRVTKVAGVEVALREGQRPRVDALLIGPVTTASRIQPALGRLVQRITGGRRDRRIDWSRVIEVGADVCLDVSADSIGAGGLEDWVASHIIKKVPFSK